MTMFRPLSFMLLSALAPIAIAQYAPPDPSGFQRIIVEPYYVADANDAADLDGGESVPVVQPLRPDAALPGLTITPMPAP